MNTKQRARLRQKIAATADTGEHDIIGLLTKNYELMAELKSERQRRRDAEQALGQLVAEAAANRGDQ